jgi:hypothetical protein
MNMLGINQVRKALVTTAVIIGLAAPAFAAGPHSHAGGPQVTLQVKLNNGQRWQSDEALRTGMNRMRDVMATALPKIHRGKLSAAEFTALAGKVQEQIDYVTANCKLPEDADLVLHGILEQIIGGADAMKARTKQGGGAAKIVGALNVYGKSFDHPGWKALTH